VTYLYIDESGVGLLFVRITAGCSTGALAILSAQPTDVVKVRMQAEAGQNVTRYNGVFDAYRTIAREEGMKGLYKGEEKKKEPKCLKGQFVAYFVDVTNLFG